MKGSGLWYILITGRKFKQMEKTAKNQLGHSDSNQPGLRCCTVNTSKKH